MSARPGVHDNYGLPCLARQAECLPQLLGCLDGGSANLRHRNYAGADFQMFQSLYGVAGDTGETIKGGCWPVKWRWWKFGKSIAVAAAMDFPNVGKFYSRMNETKGAKAVAAMGLPLLPPAAATAAVGAVGDAVGVAAGAVGAVGEKILVLSIPADVEGNLGASFGGPHESPSPCPPPRSAPPMTFQCPEESVTLAGPAGLIITAVDEDFNEVDDGHAVCAPRPRRTVPALRWSGSRELAARPIALFCRRIPVRTRW